MNGVDILITGGSGFIGREVTKELLQLGYNVHIIINNSRLPDQNRLFQYKLDLLNLDQVNNFMKDHAGMFKSLVHLAWYVGPKCHVHDLNLDWTIASLNLLKNFAAYGGECFLCAGTCSEYKYEYGYLSEEITPVFPGTLYGNSKSSLREIASAYCHNHGIIFKWPRIFNLYGPYEKQSRLMPSVILSCLKNEDVRVSDCLKYQDYLHVSDTANGIVKFLQSEKNGEMNICSGEPVQLKVIVRKIAELTNFKGSILWGAIKSAFGDQVVVGNNSKLLTLGWKPKYSLDQGLLDAVEWWKANLNN